MAKRACAVLEEFNSAELAAGKLRAGLGRVIIHPVSRIFQLCLILLASYLAGVEADCRAQECDGGACALMV